MSLLIRLAALGGLGYFAYRQGWLDSFLDGEYLMEGISIRSPQGDKSDLFEINSAEKTSAVKNKELELLDAHYADVQPWARRNMAWVSAMMWQESRGNANAISPAGARGVMQVMPGTQDDLVRWGWDKYQPDHMDLHLPNVGIYFGTAYLEYLSQQSSDREWITRAYNAGPGGQRSNGSWPAETVDYLARIIERYNAIRGG